VPRLLAVATLVSALALAGCRSAAGPHELQRILCLGDSITAGVTRSSAPGRPMSVDPLGGYPGRLQRRLGDRVRVMKRAVGGATTTFWLADPREPTGAAFWSALMGAESADQPPAGAASVVGAVMQHDRPELVVILLGVNDLNFAARERVEAVVGEVAERLTMLQREVLSVARVALVATALPSLRDPPPLRDALNARIRAEHPDFLPLGERFAAAGWERLLGDEIHPNEDGYEVLAAILAEELTRRALVAAPANNRR